MCLSPRGQPCHKTCAEHWLDEHGGCFDCSGTGRNCYQGRILPGACPVCNGSGKTPRVDEAQQLAGSAYRVLVTGSRTWVDADRVATALGNLHAEHGDRLTIVHGACPKGADAITDAWCRRVGVAVERHPAQWSTAGRRAGYDRNAAMVATAPDACLAFVRYASPGATQCAELAERAGIPTERHSVPPPADVLADIHSGRYGVLAGTDRVVVFEDDRQVRRCAEEDTLIELVRGGYAAEHGDRHTVTCRLGPAIRNVTPLRLTGQGRRCLQGKTAIAPK